MKFPLFIFAVCVASWAQEIDATTLGIDCGGKVDNAPTWARIIVAAGEDVIFTLPRGCVDMHASTVVVPSEAGFKLTSHERAQNGGGDHRPIELWAGTRGGMWDFQANQAPTVEGFLFTNTTPVDYYLRFGGKPARRIGTEALVQYNTFTNTLNNPNFQAVTFVPEGNGEKNIVRDNDFFCSQSRAARESDSGQITAGSKMLTCGLGNCSFMANASIGDRVRVSYATGLLDTTVATKTDDNHIEMADAAVSTQGGARIHFRQAYGTGIYIGSVNSKHNTIERNSFTQCACGLSVYNGSFSSAHFGGSANDTLACISNIAEPSDLAYLEDESALRELYVGNMDAPLTVSYARNSIYNAELDGFIYFLRGARVTVRNSTTQGPFPVNSVLFRAANPYTVALLSLGNSWDLPKKNLGFDSWFNINSPQGALVSCGDFGITDEKGNWIPPTFCGSWR